VIIWCNGQRLTDLPFERAIEVMRSSAILDLVVQRPSPPNHLYDCPEPLWTRGSSGYDSETSSMVAASPPPQHPNNPSSSPQHHQHHDGRMHQRYPRDDACNRNGRSVIRGRKQSVRKQRYRDSTVDNRISDLQIFRNTWELFGKP